MPSATHLTRVHLKVAERRQLLEDMSAGLGVMAAGFGQEHQLVRKATVIWESAGRDVEVSNTR
jgi:hypothetical protein